MRGNSSLRWQADFAHTQSAVAYLWARSFGQTSGEEDQELDPEDEAQVDALRLRPIQQLEWSALRVCKPLLPSPRRAQAASGGGDSDRRSSGSGCSGRFDCMCVIGV